MNGLKKVKVEDIVLYDRLSIYEKGTRMNIVYPVIRIYLSKPTSKIKYKYWCNKKSTYFHIYDKKDNYDKFIETRAFGLHHRKQNRKNTSAVER